jgi:hypothetical protein
VATKQCPCGQSFTAGSNRAKWCPACKTEQTRAANDRYNAKRGQRAEAVTAATSSDRPGNEQLLIRLGREYQAEREHDYGVMPALPRGGATRQLVSQVSELANRLIETKDPETFARRVRRDDHETVGRELEDLRGYAENLATWADQALTEIYASSK